MEEDEIEEEVVNPAKAKKLERIKNWENARKEKEKEKEKNTQSKSGIIE